MWVPVCAIDRGALATHLTGHMEEGGGGWGGTGRDRDRGMDMGTGGHRGHRHGEHGTAPHHRPHRQPVTVPYPRDALEKGGGGTPLQGTQPMPVNGLPDGRCRAQW